jgi:hypothetical protein
MIGQRPEESTGWYEQTLQVLVLMVHLVSRMEIPLILLLGQVSKDAREWPGSRHVVGEGDSMWKKIERLEGS